MSQQIVQDTLAISGQSDDVIGNKVDLTFSGTWTGTIALQIYASAGWQNTGDTWTANGSYLAESAQMRKWRVDFTRASGTLSYDIRSAMGEP
jgi:hypothetical protein